MNFRIPFHYLLLIFSLIVFTAPALEAQCKVSQIVEQGKLEIDPKFLYDGLSLSNFTMNDKAKKVRVQFLAMKGQQYKLYFCNSGFSEEVKVSVFKEEKNGELSTDLLGTTTLKDQFIEFSVAKSGNYFVEYTIPPCENAEFGNTKKECMVMLISYKNK
jgi:hypothetical protein